MRLLAMWLWCLIFILIFEVEMTRRSEVHILTQYDLGHYTVTCTPHILYLRPSFPHYSPCHYSVSCCAPDDPKMTLICCLRTAVGMVI